MNQQQRNYLKNPNAFPMDLIMMLKQLLFQMSFLMSIFEFDYFPYLRYTVDHINQMKLMSENSIEMTKNPQHHFHLRQLHQMENLFKQFISISSQRFFFLLTQCPSLYSMISSINNKQRICTININSPWRIQFFS